MSNDEPKIGRFVQERVAKTPCTRPVVLLGHVCGESKLFFVIVRTVFDETKFTPANNRRSCRKNTGEFSRNSISRFTRFRVRGMCGRGQIPPGKNHRDFGSFCRDAPRLNRRPRHAEYYCQQTRHAEYYRSQRPMRFRPILIFTRP